MSGLQYITMRTMIDGANYECWAGA